MIIIGTLLFALLLMSDGTLTRKELKKCDCTDDSKVGTRFNIVTVLLVVIVHHYTLNTSCYYSMLIVTCL